MADYVVITTQFVKAWADLAKNEYTHARRQKKTQMEYWVYP